MANITARNKLLKVLKKNNWYAVVWDGHADKYFVCLKLPENGKKTNEIYSAIYESYYDLVGEDEEVLKISVGYNCKSWNSVFKLLKSALKEKTQ